MKKIGRLRRDSVSGFAVRVGAAEKFWSWLRVLISGVCENNVWIIDVNYLDL